LRVSNVAKFVAGGWLSLGAVNRTRDFVNGPVAPVAPLAPIPVAPLAPVAPVAFPGRPVCPAGPAGIPVGEAG